MRAFQTEHRVRLPHQHPLSRMPPCCALSIRATSPTRCTSLPGWLTFVRSSSIRWQHSRVRPCMASTAAVVATSPVLHLHRVRRLDAPFVLVASDQVTQVLRRLRVPFRVGDPPRGTIRCCCHPALPGFLSALKKIQGEGSATEVCHSATVISCHADAVAELVLDEDRLTGFRRPEGSPPRVFLRLSPICRAAPPRKRQRCNSTRDHRLPGLIGRGYRSWWSFA